MTTESHALVKSHLYSLGPGSFDRNAWQELATQGLFAPFADQPYNQTPQSLNSVLALLYDLGAKRQLGLAFSAGAHLFAVMAPLRKFATAEQRQRWMPGLASGELIGAIAVAEPGGSSDAFALSTLARKTGDGYRLSGEKNYITNANVCDLALVFASDADDPKKVICAVVERNAPAFITDRPTATMGLPGSDLGAIQLDDYFVPASCVIAIGQRAKWLFMHAMEWERGLILTPLVGLMSRQIEECMNWAAARRQGNGTLFDIQAVRHRLADMKKRYHVAKLALDAFAESKVRNKNGFGEAALTKIIVSDAFLENSMDAMKLYGAHGYTLASSAQQDLRDAMAFQAASGTTDVLKNIVADCLQARVL